MAISDQQIFDWFLANPNADDATIAATMDQFKLSPVDIARATGTNLSNVQSRHEAVAPPAAPVAKTSEVYLGDNRWLNTATGQIRTDWSQSAPVKQIVREEDRDGMHYRYYDDGSVDSSALSTDNFLDFVGDVAPGIALKTALTMAGGPAGAELGLTLGSGLNTALDLGLSNAAQQAIGSGLIRGTLADATGGDFVTGALSGAAAASPNLTLGDTGITLGNLNTANKVLNADDTASVLSALAADKTISGATSGLLDASTTQALNTGLQVNNIVTQLQAGNEGAALTLLGDLAGSSDLKTAGNAVKAIDAIESGNVGALTSAVVNLSNTAGSTTGTSGSTSGGGSSVTAGSNITTLTDEDLAELQPGELNAYQTGGVQGLADFRRDMRLLNSLTTSGRTGDDLGGGTIDEVIKDATTTETAPPADTSGTAGADTTDLGSLLDMTNTTDDTVVVKGDKPLDYLPTDDDFVPTKIDDKGEVVITGGRPADTTSTDTTGLDEGPIIPTGGDGLETVTVTGGTDTDTTGLDEGPVIPAGDKLKDEGELVVTGKRDPCPPGTHYDETLDACVPDDTGDDDIEELVVTDKKCDPGYVYDEDLKQCVPIVTTPVVKPPVVVQPPVVNLPVVKTTPTTYTPSTGIYTSGEENKPIYAEGMDEFNLFATLQQLLAEEPEKKDSKKSKEKTKMATGGHLDDLLAEQMTVDDLLKLLR